MLRIRKTQLHVFQAAADAEFEWRVAEHLRVEHPDAGVRLPEGGALLSEIPEGRLLELVRGGIARARAYGMTWQSSITAFVVLMFVVAPNFDRHPLIRHVLTDSGVRPDERLDALWENTTQENWQAAADNYDPASWGTSEEEG
jgi:hypothetical protein